MAYTTINNSTDNFRVKLYTGNDTARSITFDESTNLQPDLMWIKSRSHGASWLCNDVLRGATKRFKIDTNDAESTQAQMITAFDTNGFSLGTSSTSNGNTYNFASYSWKANGAGSANTDGDITSTVSVNTTAGFSIVKYTGNGSNAQTVGHGLGSVPKVIIVKPMNYSDHWSTYHEPLGNTKYLYLDGDNSVFTGASRWSDTSPTSSLFTIGTGSPATGGGYTYDYIAYCFADVTGYSKFGSYIHNGSSGTSGNFIYTGFKPKWLMLKNTSSGSTDWLVQDTTRSTFNDVDDCLFANENSAESVNFNINFLSNGFKLSGSGPTMGSSGNTVIYMAFGQSLVGTNNIPATAR